MRQRKNWALAPTWCQRRQPHTQLGFAVQLGTVRFLGTFLADPLDVPREVVAYVAGELAIDPACFAAYAERAMAPYEHTCEIRRAYDYRDYAAAEEELHALLAARAWTSNEGPRALFDRATAWLIEHKVPLPGATTLARAIVAIRATAAEDLWRALVGGVDAALRQRLERLLDVESGARYSTLERLSLQLSDVPTPAGPTPRQIATTLSGDRRHSG